MLLDIATGQSRNETQWRGEKWSWEQLVQRCMKVVRTGETFTQYSAGTVEFKQSKKDVGGFVSGWLDGGRRTKAAVLTKQILTLDIDNANLDFIPVLRARLPNVAWIYYTTHSHSPDKPRYRLLIPLDRPAVPSEYEPVARWVASYLGIEQFDRTCYDLNRLMFWPSAADDGHFEADYQNGMWASVNGILGQYNNYLDISQWPVADGEYLAMRKDAQQMEDPHAKSGAIGAFCRMYSTTQMLDKFLGHVYEPGNQPNRYTYKHGSTSNGLWIIDDKFVLSFHSTDPLGNKPVNVFDLYRVHICGGANDDPDKPVGKQASFKMAMERVSEIPEVKRQLIAEGLISRNPSAYEFFGIQQPVNGAYVEAIKPQVPVMQVMQPEHVLPLNGHVNGAALNGHGYAPTAPLNGAAMQAYDAAAADWILQFDTDPKKRPLSTVKNVVLILENDPRLKGCIGKDVFSKRLVSRNLLPWATEGVQDKDDNEWTDVDDDNLIGFLDREYGISVKDKILTALSIVADRNKFHPVRDYLNSLIWDGQPRIELLFTKFLGVPYDEFTREVSRKWLTAAVARVFQPGIKFDNMLVFVGQEGVGKSYLFDKLAGKWFSDTSVDLRNKKEAMEDVQGVWIMEWAELTSFRSSSIEMVKAFVGKRVDKFRAAFARRVETHKRQLVFVGTTNNEEFLSEADGHRRIWPLRVDQLPREMDVSSHFTEELRGQIWAEAYQLYMTGEPLVLSKEVLAIAKERQQEHTEKDPRDQTIVEYLDKLLPVDWYQLSEAAKNMYLANYDPNEAAKQPGLARRDKVSVKEIWVEAFQGDKKDAERNRTRFISTAMKNLPGWTVAKNPLEVGNYGRQRCYVRVDSGVKTT